MTDQLSKTQRYLELRREKTRRACRSSIKTFAKYYLKFTPDPWQAQLWESKTNVILNLARQSGKSTACAIMALHRAIYNPHKTVVVTAKSLRQSVMLFRKITGFLNDIKWQFRTTITGIEEQTKLTIYFENGSCILCLPGSPDTIRGVSSVDLLLVDEAALCSDDLFQAVIPMLAVSKGQMVMLSTPNGRAGYFYEIWLQWEKDGIDSGWQGIKLPALLNRRIERSFLDQQKKTLSPLRYKTEFECEFLDADEQLISSEMIEALKDSEVPILML